MRKGLTINLGRLAQLIGAQLLGAPELEVHGVATLQEAISGTLSFLSHRKYRTFLPNTQASAVILSAEHVQECPCAILLHANPKLAYARAMHVIFSNDSIKMSGIHPSAVVDPSACIDPTAWIGPQTVIGPQVIIAEDVFIGPSCVVEANCLIGAKSRLVARVTLCSDTKLGNNVKIQPGAVIGADGFGFAQDTDCWVPIPQLGRVVIGNNVEIGANTTIDRGSLNDTTIADGAILDNLIQIGHNVHIGKNTAVVACTGISGSTKIGNNCLIGGDVGIAGHLEISDKVCLAAGSKVTKNIDNPGYYGGVLPVDPDPLWRRNVTRLRHLDELARKVRQLELLVAGRALNEPTEEIHDKTTPDI
ncbi:hypothetical protein TI04_00440 [Achromatium sp. WMS2]|nr:hypothetical protein TI04_00440 [Achromatium sp. WMS2]